MYLNLWKRLVANHLQHKRLGCSEKRATEKVMRKALLQKEFTATDALPMLKSDGRGTSSARMG